MSLPPLNSGVTFALAKLVEDARGPDRRDPSHDQISDAAQRSGVKLGDLESRAGKAKRVRAMLMWAIEHDQGAGRQFVDQLVALVRACGGFNPASVNACPQEAITNLRYEFDHEGWVLDGRGHLLPAAIPSGGSARTAALCGWAARLAVGDERSPWIVTEQSDILTLAGKWAIENRYTGEAPEHPALLLSTAYNALSLPMPGSSTTSPKEEVAQALFMLGQALLNLRDSTSASQWHPSVDDAQALWATRAMGQVAAYLLARL